MEIRAHEQRDEKATEKGKSIFLPSRASADYSTQIELASIHFSFVSLSAKSVSRRRHRIQEM